MPRPSVLPLFVLSLIAPLCVFSLDDFSYLKALDTPSYFCRRDINLNLSRDLFTEISNQIPGSDEYNEMVQLFHGRKWDKLKLKVELFKKVHESSPLKEPVSFLEVQHQLERVVEYDSEKTVKAEMNLRNSILLYPKSEFVPGVLANLGYFLLKNGQYLRSMSVYESLVRQYPESELSCVFRMGAGESSFRLLRWEEGSRYFKEVLEKCKNLKLKAISEVRMAEGKWFVGGKDTEAFFEKAVQNNSQVVDTAIQLALYELGEIKYQSKKYLVAKHFFEQYLKNEIESGECIPYALKRMADIEFQLGASLEKVMGMYLAVREKAPNTDIGRYANLHALLMTLSKVSKLEIERRLRLVDEEINKLVQKDYRELVHVEKGIALLTTGEVTAVNFLSRFQSGGVEEITQPELRKYISRVLADTLLTLSGEGKKPKKEARKDMIADIQRIENLYKKWFFGMEDEKRVRQIYSKLVLDLFESTIEGKNIDRAVPILKRWSSSPLWSPEGLNSQEQAHVAKVLIREILKARHKKGQESGDLALEYIKAEQALMPFTNGPGFIVWLAVALAAGDQKKVLEIIEKINGSRKLSSIDNVMNEIGDYYWLTLGEGYMRSGQFKEGIREYLKVKSPEFKSTAEEGLFNIYRRTGDSEKAYDQGVNLVKISSGDRPKEYLEWIRGLVLEKKLWKKVPQVADLALKMNLSGAELTPYYHLMGRSFSEKGSCEKSIGFYEKAIKTSPENGLNAEARFRMGKCLVKLKKKNEARKIWQELIGMQDTFWSPLAKNEIALMKP